MINQMYQRILRVIDLWIAELVMFFSRRPEILKLKLVNNDYSYENGDAVLRNLSTLDKQHIQCELDTKKVAFVQLDIPPGAENHIAGIVSNKLPQVSPWQLSSLVYGYYVEAKNKDNSDSGSFITIAMANAEKCMPDFLSPKKNKGYQPKTISYQVTSQSGQEITLSGTDQQDELVDNDSSQRIKLILVAMVFTLIASWSAGSIATVWQEQQLDNLHNRQLTARRLLEQKTLFNKNTNNPTEAMIAKVASVPSRFATLEMLAHILPDEVYLQSVEIDQDVIRFSAIARDAAAALRLVADSNLFEEAAFSTPTVKQKYSELLELEITAKISNSVEAGLEMELLLIGNEAAQ